MRQIFDLLPGSSKVWIYQSSRELTEAEAIQMTGQINDFIRQWMSHSKKVAAEGAVIYNRFVILAADESAAEVGGCSIDSSVHFIRQLEQQFQISLFDRLTVAYRQNGNILTASQSEFQDLMDKGLVNQDTVVFNNLVATVNELRQNWEVPLAKSWHTRLFNSASL
jgi:hypothetical protein